MVVPVAAVGAALVPFIIHGVRRLATKSVAEILKKAGYEVVKGSTKKELKLVKKKLRELHLLLGAVGLVKVELKEQLELLNSLHLNKHNQQQLQKNQKVGKK